MSSKMPERSIAKTGLAARLRAWMSARGRKFTVRQIYEAFCLAPGRERAQAAKALQDFMARGEVVPAGTGQAGRRQAACFAYNPDWRRRSRGMANRRIYKAMYV